MAKDEEEAKADPQPEVEDPKVELVPILTELNI